MCKTDLRAPVIVALVVMLAIFSSAPGTAQVAKGAFEIGFETGPFLFIGSGGGETVGGLGLVVEPHVGYFVSDALAIGATGLFYHTFDTDPSVPSLSFGGAFGHVNYHFNPGGTWSPYVGGRLGVFDPYEEMFFAFGVQTGLQFFATRQLSVNGQLVVEIVPGSRGIAFLCIPGFWPLGSSLAVGVSWQDSSCLLKSTRGLQQSGRPAHRRCLRFLPVRRGAR